MKYTVKIVGPGMSFEHEVNEEVAKRTMLSLLTGESQDHVNKGNTGTKELLEQEQNKKNDAGSQPEKAIREFMLDFSPKRIPDKIATIAYFLKTNKSKDTFSKSDLIKSFEDAAEPVPKNLGRDIRWTLQSGWIAAKTGETGQYYITSTGESVVKSNFPADKIKSTRYKSATSRRNSKKKKDQHDTE